MRTSLAILLVLCGCGNAAAQELNVPDWVAKARMERSEVKRKYGALFQEVSAILFRHDPIGINFETNTDEYDPEAGTIIPKLKECRSKKDVQEVVFREFRRWFGADTAGKKETYLKPSEEIWNAWLRFQSALK